MIFIETPANGERWVWYAANGSAHLWSGTDRFVLGKSSSQLNGDLLVTHILTCPVVKGVDAGAQPGVDPQLRVWARDLILEHVTVNPATGTAAPQVPGDNGGNIALSHLPGDKLVVNHGDGYTGGVTIEGKQGLGIEGPLRLSGTLSFPSDQVSISSNGIIIQDLPYLKPGETPHLPRKVQISSNNIAFAFASISGLAPGDTWTELNLTNNGMALETKVAASATGGSASKTIGAINITAEGITLSPTLQAPKATWGELKLTNESIILETTILESGSQIKSTLDLFSTLRNLQTELNALGTKVSDLKAELQTVQNSISLITKMQRDIGDLQENVTELKAKLHI